MRFRIGAVVALASAAWMIGPVGPAAADPEKASADCTIIGTPGPDVLRGTNHVDHICGLGGDDKLIGRGGDDVLQGGGGDDVLVGGPGDDLLGGGRGDDTLNGLDDATARDRLRCGRGDDTAKADVPDVVSGNCETVRQHHVPTDLSLTPTTYAENQPVGTTVGSLGVVDADAGEAHTFTLVPGVGSSDNAKFAISGSALKVAALLDFETAPHLSIRVRTTDAAGLTFEKQFAITVTDRDDPPVAVDDTLTVTEDAAIQVVDVLANDTDVDGGQKRVQSVGPAAHGTAEDYNGGLGAKYTPAANYCGPDSFTYTLNGGSTATVAVTVTCVDDGPTAFVDAVTVDEDSAATTVDVLANDTDIDGGPKVVQAVTSPAHGTSAITGGGTGVSYQPAADYCGPDSFTYTLNGGSTAPVAVAVTCVDDPPTAVDDSGSTTEDAGAAAVTVLANDTDIDGGPRTIASVTQPAHGAVVVTGGGAGLTYAPDADYCNTPTPPFDTFTYTLNGGSTGTVSMTVNCADDAPVAVDDAATVGEDDPATAIGVLANDTDVDGGPRSIASVTQPAHGAVVVTGGGSGLTYTPDANYCNTPTPPFDTFTYALAPGGSVGTVRVTVTCVDDTPVAVDDDVTVGEDSGASPLPVLTNDTDIDGGPRSVASVTQPAHGTVVVTGGGAGLTYAPDADYCTTPPGTTPDTFTYTLSPGGSSATVSVTVTCVDDPPVAADDDATVVLDAPATPVAVLANDTDVDGGPKSIASASDPTHGAVVVTGGGTGLTYQPDAGYCNDGSPFDTFTYTLDGGSTATVRMTVTCDVAPTAVDDSATVAEDAAAAAVTVLANDTDPDGGPKAIGSVTQPGHGSVVVTGGGTGLTYEPDANYCNTPTPPFDTFTYSLAPGGSTATVSMTVTCADDAPVAVDDSTTVTEDSAANAVAVLANDTDVDGGPKSVQSVTQPAHGVVLITGGGTGLTYQPTGNYCGADAFTYTLNGGSTAAVSVAVTCTPDAPVVGAGGSVGYTENDPATVVAPALTVTDPDVGGSIAGATVQLTTGYAGVQDVLALANPLTHAPITASYAAGTLTLAGSASPAAYQSALRDVTYVNTSDAPSTATRTATFTVTDDSALSGAATRNITVTAADDPPVAADDSATVLEDSGAAAVTVLANDPDVDGGPKSIGSVTQPAHGTVVVTGGGTGLTYAPAADYCNNPPGTTPDTFTYTLTPGGSSATVSMTVTCVNDAPVAGDDSFSAASSAVGNTVLVVNAPGDGPQTVAGPKKAVSGNILGNDTDVDGPTSPAAVAGTFPSNDGGSVVLESDGDFSFTPAAGTSCTDSSDFFDYTVTDANAPTAGTDTGRVSISITGCVWYVDNAAAGNAGTSTAPFDTLAQAQTASSAGDTVYVLHGDGTTTGATAGIDLKANQRLLGEAATLQVGSDVLATGVPANRPTITDNNADVVVLASGNTVRGLQLDPQGTGGGIAGGNGTAPGSITGGTIDDVRIIDQGTAGTQPGLELDTTAGTFNVSDLTVSTKATGVRLNNAGTVNFVAAGTISITTAGAKGLDASGTSLGTGSELDSITVTGSGTGAVAMNGTTGTTTFTNLALTTTSGATGAFVLTNAGTVTVPAAGTSTISATGGPAVDVTGPAALAFDDVDSTTSAGDGVNLDSFGAGTFTASTGSAISGAAGVGFDVNQGSGAISFDGTISTTAAASRPVEVTNRSGATVAFNGAVSGTGSGVLLNANAGATVRFDGGLTLSTGANAAFTATGGGTVVATQDNSAVVNILTTTTGTALTVTGTSIGASGLTFRSISSNGAANGIVLSGTGASAGLTVTGNGGTCTNASTAGCSGGQIANSVGGDSSGATPGGTGIVLNSTQSPSLTRMWLHDASNYGIRGTNVVGFTMANSVVNGTNGTNGTTPFDDSSVWFDNLTGSASVTGSTVAGGFEDNFRVTNTAGNLNRITFTSDTFGDNSAAGGNDGVLLQTSAAAGQLQATVQSSTFTGAAGDLLQYDHNGSGTGDLVLTGNAFSNNHPGIATGGGGLTLTTGGASGATTMTINGGNTFRDAVGNALTIAKSSGASTLTGTISGNTIGVNGVANSGSAEGDGVKIQSLGGGANTWTVANNVVRGYNNFGVEVLAGGSATAQAGAVNATITGNTIDQPGNTAGTLTLPKNGVHLNIGTVPGDTYAACASISGNNLASGGADGQGLPGSGFDVRLRQRQSTTIRLPGYAGAATDTTAVAAFVAANNATGGPAVTASTNVPPGGGFVGGAACPQ